MNDTIIGLTSLSLSGVLLIKYTSVLDHTALTLPCINIHTAV